jgi:hypothetical protein
VVIFTIGLGADVDEAALRDMASQPSFYRHAPTGAELAAIYREVVDLIPCPGSSFWGGRAGIRPGPAGGGGRPGRLSCQGCQAPGPLLRLAARDAPLPR